jgi:hypothetical protein
MRGAAGRERAGNLEVGMTCCIKCHRPLRLPSPDGYGPVCRKAIVQSTERDLFGFDIDRASEAACKRVVDFVASLAATAQTENRTWFKNASARFGVAA